MTRKKVLVVHYPSPSGQLSDVLDHFTAPLEEATEIECHHVWLRPAVAYPFPWPVLRFFDTFPETVYLDAPELQPLELDADAHFDLVILGYQVWFLAPSMPTTGFLKSPEAQQLLRDTPVVTVIACRDMWLMAQERTKALLAACGARLVGNVALVDEAGSAGSFLATPLWMLTGKRGPFLRGLIPRAGVNPARIRATRRFGARIVQTLTSDRALDTGLLRDMGAVSVNTRLIAMEKTGRRSFLLWGALLRALGLPGGFFRRAVLIVYIVFLVTLILTIVPLLALAKTLLAPLLHKRLKVQQDYFSQPSGE